VAIKMTHLAELVNLPECLAERLNPGRRAATRKTLPKVKASLAESGNAGPKRKRSNLDVLGFCVGLLQAAGNPQARDSAGSGGAAEFFFFDGGDDGGLVHEDDGRIAAEGPDAEG
jgi:hypothetical protein